MSIVYLVNKDIFLTGADAIVNPVNCKGVMGAGLAYKFKLTYPSNFAEYKKYCDEGRFKPGSIFTYRYNTPRKLDIINMSTKDHWKDKSKLEDIATGLRLIDQQAIFEKYKTIALPKVGCGLGGLNWTTQVQPLVERAFKEADYTVLVCI